MTSTESTCIVCNGQFGSKQKAGEISIRLAIKGGASIVVAGPVCPSCAEKSAGGPEIALAQMRSARACLLIDAGEVQS